mgnify:CR=1 FL=1
MYEEQEKELEKLTDHQRVVLCDIQEEADVLDELLDAPRLDRKKLKKAASSIWLSATGNCNTPAVHRPFDGTDKEKAEKEDAGNECCS